MPIQLSPETELLVEQEIASGRFHSIEEIIQQGIRDREQITESERLNKHRKAIDWTREFAENRALPLHGVTIRELVEEGRRM